MKGWHWKLVKLVLEVSEIGTGRKEKINSGSEQKRMALAVKVISRSGGIALTISTGEDWNRRLVVTSKV